MAVIKTQAFTVTKKPGAEDSPCWNVDLNGRPFGSIWTFKAPGELHPFHAKPLRGEHTMFSSYAAAEAYLRGLA